MTDTTSSPTMPPRPPLPETVSVAAPASSASPEASANESSAPGAAVAPRAPRRRGLVIGGIVVAAVLALGGAFGGGVATGFAVSQSQVGTGTFTPGDFPGGGPQMGPGGRGTEQGSVPTRPDEEGDSSSSEEGTS